MAKNILVVNVDIRETRVALIEDGILVELHIERETSKGTLGNVYVGKVSRVLPGMQAAFIDIGLERAAFLHVEDLIRPDDFEAYLSGRGRGADHEERPAGRGPSHPVTRAGEAEAAALPEPTEEEEDEFETPDEEAAVAAEAAREAAHGDFHEAEELDAEGSDASLAMASEEFEGQPIELESGPVEAENGEAFGSEPLDLSPTVDIDVDVDVEDAHEPDVIAESGAADDGSADADEVEAHAESEVFEGAGDELSLDILDETPEAYFEAPVEQPSAHESAAGEADGEPVVGLEGVVVSDIVPVGETDGTVRVDEARAKRGRGRVRRSVRTKDRQVAVVAAPAPELRPAGRENRDGRDNRNPRGDRRDRNDRGDRGDRAGDRGGDRGRQRQNEPPRVSKTTPIREVVREGQEVLVQVSKEPIGTKGARVTSHISLPGRYVVFLPTVDHIGISKRIGSEKERARLRESIEGMKPPSGGLIVRTVAEGLTKKQLKADVGYLVRLWGEIVKKREAAGKAPACLYAELELVLKIARDLFTDDIEKIVIDDREEFLRLRRFVEVFLPERVEQIELYEGEEPIFDAYGIEDEIGRALSRKVPLTSGGHLVIDQAEALTAIDVNTGRFVGKGSKDLEETILMTNLEAVEEIAYQLRFRNIGGLIILDLIDMERPANREKVRRRLEQVLAKDKAKTTLNRISELGLIEMTRKRTRESLGRQIHEPCFYCDGTGQLQSKHSIAYEILRQVRRERLNLRGYVIVVNAHPAVVDLLKNEERIAVTEAERRFQRRIELVPRKEYHIEQFDLQGR